MYPFFETIQIKNGKPLLLSYHQKRVDRTFSAFYTDKKAIDLYKIIVKNLPKNPPEILKCKISYNDKEYTIAFEKYIPQIHVEFILISANDFTYSYKYTNREFFKSQQEKNPEKGIIFVHNQSITDSSYANLIFKKNATWFTPDTYLLQGTQRSYLLEKGRIEEQQINIDTIREYESFKQINAMLSFEDSYEYPIDRIIPKRTIKRSNIKS